MRVFAGIFAVSFGMYATVVSADTCNLESTLDAKGKELRSTISVSKEDRDYISSLGFDLHKGLFGARYIKTDDLLAILRSYGCDIRLLNWVMSNSKRSNASSVSVSSNEGSSGTESSSSIPGGGWTDDQPGGGVDN